MPGSPDTGGNPSVPEATGSASLTDTIRAVRESRNRRNTNLGSATGSPVVVAEAAPFQVTRKKISLGGQAGIVESTNTPLDRISTGDASSNPDSRRGIRIPHPNIHLPSLNPFGRRNPPDTQTASETDLTSNLDPTILSRRPSGFGLSREQRQNISDETAAAETGAAEALGRNLTPAEKAELKHGVGAALDYKLPRILGGASIKETLAETAAVGSIAFLLKTAAKIGIRQAGWFSSLGTTIAIGAAGGAIQAGVREGYKQFVKERQGERKKEWAEARAKHRNLVVASLAYADKRRLVGAVLRGSATGAIGSVIGFEIAETGIGVAAGHFLSEKIGGIGATIAPATKGIKEYVSSKAPSVGPISAVKTPDVGQFVNDRAGEAGRTVSGVTQSPRQFIADRTNEFKHTVGLEKGNQTTGTGQAAKPAVEAKPTAVATSPDVQKNIDALQSQLAKSEAVNRALFDQNQDLHNQITTLQTHQVDVDETVNNATTRIQGELTRWQTGYQSLDANYARLSDINHNLENQVDSLTKQLNEVKQAAETAKSAATTATSGAAAPLTGLPGDGPTIPGAPGISKDLLNTKITINPGESFLQKFHIPENLFPNGLAHGWINPDVPGVNQEEVVKDMIVKLAKAHGHNLDIVQAGQNVDLAGLGLTEDDMKLLQSAMASKDADDYINNVMPKFQAAIGKS